MAFSRDSAILPDDSNSELLSCIVPRLSRAIFPAAARSSPYRVANYPHRGVMMIVEGDLGWPEDGSPASMGLP
jgi:hypothetical protein